SLILAAKCPRQNTAYFQERMRDKKIQSRFEWQVCGNLLAGQAAPGFADMCLARLELPLSVTVRDGKPPPRSMTGSAWGPAGPTRPRVPAEFPLIPHYQLLDGNLPRDGLVPSEPLYGREPDHADLSAWWGGYAEPQTAFAAWLRTMGAARTRDAVTHSHAIT